MIVNEFEIRSYGWQDGPLRAGFDAGIGRETVVQMGGGRPGVRDGAAGLRLAEREEDVDTPTGEDNRAVFG